MVIEIPKFWTISFTNLAKNTTKFPAAFGGQRFALVIGSKTLFKKHIYAHCDFKIIEIFGKTYIWSFIYMVINPCNNSEILNIATFFLVNKIMCFFFAQTQCDLTT